MFSENLFRPREGLAGQGKNSQKMTQPGGGDFHLLDFQGFTCTACGLCCTRPWGIGIEPEVEPGIRGSRLFAQRQREGYLPISIAEDTCLPKANRKSNGDCMFLAEENQCGLHSELGAQGKPVGCQIYPYRAVSTPTGTYFSQSWVCPPVVAGLDRNVEENRGQLQELLRRFPDAAARLPDNDLPVRLTADVHISWTSYLHLEKRLLEGYHRDRPADSLMAIVTSLLAVANLPDKVGDDWPALGKLADDMSFERELLTMYLTGIISAIETEHDLERRAGVQAALAGGAPVVSLHLGTTLPCLSRETPQSPRLLEAFERYFRNMVAGKNLLSPSLVKQLLALAIGHAMLEFYAEAFRLKRGEAELSLESLTCAFEIVESQLFHSDTLAPFFVDFESTLLVLSAASQD